MRDATARQLRHDEYRQTAQREARGQVRDARGRIVDPAGTTPGHRAGTERGSREARSSRRLHLVEPFETVERSTEYEPTYAENGRRTVTITGHPVPSRRRSPTATQIQARPDRIALWAVLLGLFLVFMAVATASAATL